MSKRNLDQVYDLEAATMNGRSEISVGGGGSEAELKKAKLDESLGNSNYQASLLQPHTLAHSPYQGHGDGGMLNGGMPPLPNSNGTNGLPMQNGQPPLQSPHIYLHPHAQQQQQHQQPQLPTSGPLNSSSTNPPSRVVHIRGIPNDCQDGEIVALGMSFGRISNVLILKGKNQAFLEMADELSAIHMVNYYNSGFPCVVKNKQCFVQHSTHKELRTDQYHANQGMNVMNALSAMNAPMSLKDNLSMMLSQQGNHLPPGLGGLGMGNSLIPPPGLMSSVAAAGGPGGGMQSQEYGGMNTILRVVVENVLYPVSLEILNGIFSRFGKVLRIITFTKNHQFQALIQYPDRQSASVAKQNLDGQNIYAGCCTLRIEYSRLDNLRVNFNNDKSRDYTNPNLPAGDLMIPDAHLQLHGFNPAAAAGLLHGLTSPHGLQNVTNAAAYNASLLQGMSAGALGALGGLGRLAVGGSTVVLVSNINEEVVTPEMLFILFGVYGDVMRVKILFNKKDTALIQYAEPRQAQLAIVHLDRVKLFGKGLKVTNSKHTEVQLPKDSQPDCGLTRDFSNSPLHRFKKPGSKNYQNIYPPASTLHLSNLPPNMTEEDVINHFAKHGFTVKHFRFFPKDHRMALIQLNTVEEAIEALIKMHNFQLNENTHLRVSFSKATIKDN